MFRTSIFWFSIILCAILAQKCFCYKWEFLGNMTDEEYASHKLCYTKFCLKDTDILLKAATLDASVDPCQDFKNFSVGEFIEYRVPNDRYGFNGFSNDVSRNLYEKKRVVLKEKIRENEPNVFKSLKRFFKKCTDPDHVRETAANDLLSILRGYGSLSLLPDGPGLNPDFDMTKLFEFEPYQAFRTFLNHRFTRCDDPRNSSKTILCYRKIEGYEYNEGMEEEYLRLMKPLNMTEATKRELIKNCAGFLLTRQQSIDSLDEIEYDKIFKIRDLSSYFSSLNINWFKIINRLQFRDSQVTEDEEILIESPDLIKELLFLLEKSEPL